MAALVPSSRVLGALLSRWGGSCGRALSTKAADAPPSQRVKHKTPRRKASGILSELREIEKQKALELNAEKNIPPFLPGDAIEVKMVDHLSATEIDTYRGVVIGIKRMGADTRFKMIDVVMGTPLLNDIPLYSPFIKSIKVLQPAFIYEGKKRVRRAKLYYLWEKRDPKEYTLTG